MSDDLFLVLILSFLAGVSVLSVWAASRLGSHGRTQQARPPPYARPTGKLEDADEDLINQLRREIRREVIQSEQSR